jgi:carbonic anhydrase/acetyltransferase-like protein (isoleucine patch superfamily)
VPIYELDGERPDFPADDRYFVAETAVLIGRVRLKRDASVWWGAILRGDNEWIEVGEGTNIQDNTVMHTDPGAPLTVGDYCVVGHNVILHGCAVGNGCLIGMGAILLNHAKIGNRCVVGAGALITEDKTFPDNSLIVGAPAKAIRTLDDATAASFIKGAEGYMRNAQRYRQGLKRIG